MTVHAVVKVRPDRATDVKRLVDILRALADEITGDESEGELKAIVHGLSSSKADAEIIAGICQGASNTWLEPGEVTVSEDGLQVTINSDEIDHDIAMGLLDWIADNAADQLYVMARVSPSSSEVGSVYVRSNNRTTAYDAEDEAMRHVRAIKEGLNVIENGQGFADQLIEMAENSGNRDALLESIVRRICETVSPAARADIIASIKHASHEDTTAPEEGMKP